MSACALPIPPAGLTTDLQRPTERSATGPVVRCQWSVIRRRRYCADAPAQPLQHLRDLAIAVAPATPRRLVDVSQIDAEAQPYAHLVGRADRHRQEAPAFGRRGG